MQERKWKISSWKTWSNVTSSNPTCPPPRLFHHHRFKDGISIDGTILRSSSNHRKRKEGEGKKVALSTTSLAKRWWYRNGGELAVRKKIDRSRSRFGREDGSTSPSDPASRMVAHASMAAFLSFLSFLFFFFFPPSLSPATLLDRLSLARQEVPLFSRSWQIRLMRWTRWDMGQRIGVQCRHGRGVTVPWKRPCPGPQSRRELSAGWSPV